MARTRKVRDRLNRRTVELVKDGNCYQGEIDGEAFTLAISMEASNFNASPRPVYTNPVTGYRTDSLEAAVAAIDPIPLKGLATEDPYSLPVLQQFLEGRTWQFATTMPECPHWYTVRAEGPGEREGFERFVRAIREHGVDERFGTATYRYLSMDGYKYWTMGAKAEATTIINRVPVTAQQEGS